MQHKELSEGKWGGMAFVEQMANIGSEVDEEGKGSSSRFFF